MSNASFEALVDVLRALQNLEIPHMAVGSFSFNAYAMPRSTKDADIAVQLTGQRLRSGSRQEFRSFQQLESLDDFRYQTAASSYFADRESDRNPC